MREIRKCTICGLSVLHHKGPNILICELTEQQISELEALLFNRKRGPKLYREIVEQPQEFSTTLVSTVNYLGKRRFLGFRPDGCAARRRREGKYQFAPRGEDDGRNNQEDAREIRSKKWNGRIID